MSDDDKLKGKQKIDMPEVLKKNILTLLKQLLNVRIDWDQEGCGTKLLAIDIPFIRGFINIYVSILGQEHCVGHIAL